MKEMQIYKVYPAIPEALSFLDYLARNLWWCWNHEAIELFHRIHPAQWRKVGRNPVAFLSYISQRRFDELSNDERWEAIGALGLRQNKKEVVGIKIKLPNSYWPIKVFIDIQNEIARKFGDLLDKYESDGIEYGTGSTLSEVVNEIESSRYVLEGAFLVKSKIDLVELMNRFEEAGGGIWDAHSFDCMVESNITPELILKSKEFKKL